MVSHANSPQILVSRNALRSQRDAHIRDLYRSELGNRAPTATGKGPRYFARLRAQNSGEPENVSALLLSVAVDRTANPTHSRHPGAGRDLRQASARVLVRAKLPWESAERPTVSQSGINQSWVPASAGMTAVGGEAAE
jgi:hypothetical protein